MPFQWFSTRSLQKAVGTGPYWLLPYVEQREFHLSKTHSEENFIFATPNFSNYATVALTVTLLLLLLLLLLFHYYLHYTLTQRLIAQCRIWNQ